MQEGILLSSSINLLHLLFQPLFISLSLFYLFLSLTLSHSLSLSLPPSPSFQEFACNGTVVEHPEYGEVIQLQGDQRNNICQFLTKVNIAKPEQLKVHGF